MKNIGQIFIVLIFIMSSLFSADINATIIDGNITIYQKILKQIFQEKNTTEEIVLEKTLLQELIDLKDISLNTLDKLSITDKIDEYRNLFLYYLQDIDIAIDLELKLNKSQNKIQTIESEIKQFDLNNSRLFSFELQDAYYHKKVKLYQNAIKSIEQQITDLKEYIKKSLKTVIFNTTQLEKVLTEKENIIINYQNQVNQLQILIEQAELINDRNKIQILNKKLKNLDSTYKNEAKDLLSTQFLLFSSYLKLKDDKAFILERKISQTSIKTKIMTEDDVNKYLSPLLLSLEKSYMGQLKTLTGAGKQELKDVLYQGWTFITKPIITLNNSSISILKMILSLLIFILGFVFGAFYKHKINKLASNKKSFTASTRTILANLGYYIIITIAFFMALNVLGVKLSSIALVAGALSVGIGFGLQNIVSNFVSGLILMFERSIKIGDYIEVDEHTKGYVTDIRMRATTINTNENIDIIIPNQNFIQNNVINWTMSDNLRRFSIPFGVAYGTNAHYVIDVVKDAILNSEYMEDIVENSIRQTRVIMTEMADSSINFELLVWVKGDKMHKPKRTASEFLILIYDTLNSNNIEIPFPQQDLHIRSVDENLKFNITTNKDNSNE